MGEREHLGGVGERHRPFARGVEGVKQVDEQSHSTELCVATRSARGWDEEAHTRCQQSPEHLRESEDQEAAASKGINRPHSRPREDEIDEPESPRRKKCTNIACTGLSEHGRRIEGDDVDYIRDSVLAYALHKNMAMKPLGNLLPHICWAIITIPEA